MRKFNLRTVLVVGVACIAASCAGTQPAKAPETPNPMTPESIRGYLSATTMPSSLALAPPPPAPGSAAMVRDEETNRSALAMNGTPRWDLAARDAVLTLPAVAQTYACALNAPIGAEHTPKLIALLRRTLIDAGRATAQAKDRYRRPRPFESNGKPICTPAQEAGLRNNGSYPSGHASIGFAFGLVLSQVSPERTNALVARGREFGQSRLVCNVHWPSDVQEGQLIAAAVVARLNAEETFRNDVAAARAEVEALRAQGFTADAASCDAEASALNSGK